MIEISVFFDKLDDFSINAICFLINSAGFVFDITFCRWIAAVVTMFAFVQYRCSSGRVVPPLAAGRSPTDEIKNRRIIIGLLSLNKDI